MFASPRCGLHSLHEKYNYTRNSPAGAWGRRRRCEHWAVSLFEVAEDVLQRDDGSQTVFSACEIAGVRPDHQPNSLKPLLNPRSLLSHMSAPRARKQDFANSDLPLPLAELTSRLVRVRCAADFFEIISIFKSSTRSVRSKQHQILYKHTRQPFGIERRCLRSGSHDQRRENQDFQKMH